MEAATAFGVAYSVDGKTMSSLLGLGFDIEEASGQKHRLLPVPAVFIGSNERYRSEADKTQVCDLN
jgi:hypothetical protein